MYVKINPTLTPFFNLKMKKWRKKIGANFIQHNEFLLISQYMYQIM